MGDFRKQMHIAYKKNLLDILGQYTLALFLDFEEYSKDPKQWTIKWIDSNCLPMGDFSKEDAIKEMNTWSGDENQ